jgi:preprotein translocase subunit SecB
MIYLKKSGFRFSNPTISKISYFLHPEFTPSESSLSIENTFNTQISQDEDNCQAVVDLNIVLGDEDPSKAPFYINLTVCASFKWESGYSEDTVRTLLSINAPALLLGYARPIVASITNMSPYPAYNIPFYNFTV